MSKIRTSNHACRKYVDDFKPFVASHLFAEQESNCYIVYSYGKHFPMYLRHDNIWYGTTDGYSRSTARHKSQARPTAQIVPVTLAEMRDLIDKNTSPV